MCLGLLNPDNCFIVDVVKHVFVWVGGRASQKEKQNGLGYAHNYLKGMGGLNLGFRCCYLLRYYAIFSAADQSVYLLFQLLSKSLNFECEKFFQIQGSKLNPLSRNICQMSICQCAHVVQIPKFLKQ